jgi:hypothetical protein
LPGLETPHRKAAQNPEGAALYAGEPQDDLKPVSIGGSEAHRIDPATDDFYRRLIDLRSQVKEQLRTAVPSDQAALDGQQQGLKTLANATSYGIFVELIVEELDATENRLCFGSGHDGFPVRVNKVETPGRYFHPLLATLITGAARLMLAVAERLVIDGGALGLRLVRAAQSLRKERPPLQNRGCELRHGRNRQTRAVVLLCDFVETVRFVQSR